MAGGTTNSTRADAPSSFKAMCERVVGCLKQPAVRVVCVHGWDRVGRGRVVRHAVEMLIGGGGGDGATTTSDNNNSTDPPLFAHILRLSKQEDETEIGRRLQKMLQFERNDAGEPFGDWRVPLTLPQHAILVIIEQDLSREINLDAAFEGVSFFSLAQNLKILVPIKQKVIENPARSIVQIYDKFDILAEEETWELLQHEANDMADELCREQQQLLFTGDAIMECFLYTTLLTLFNHDRPKLPPYWWCEGLVVPLSTTTASSATSNNTSSTPNRITKEFFDMFDLLVTKFRQRSMFNDVGWGYSIMKQELTRKVSTIATTLYQSPPSRIKKKGRFMVANNKLPQDMDRWDQQGITRVSLQCSRIERLQWYPPLGSCHGTMSNTARPPKCENLSTLILSRNPLSKGIQDDFFQGMIMPNLRVLDLSYTVQLEVLPTSLTCLTNLRFLNLKGCGSLLTISPCLDTGFPNLEILNIKNCPLSRMSTASFRQLPNLRLLLTNDRSLLSLEVLDLSGTKIESLPNLSKIDNRKMFTRLDLINTKHLSIPNWENFTRIPATIHWDQCGCCTITPPHGTGTTAGYLRMCVQDVSIFRSLGQGHELWSQSFREFQIHVHPCTKRPQQHLHSVRGPVPDQSSHDHYHNHHHHHPHRECPSSTPYKNLNLPSWRKQGQNDHHRQYSNNNHDPPTNWRYLHICGVSTPFTVPMEGVLPNMHSLQLCNHDSVKLLPVICPMELRTCQVVKCPNMETVFYGRPTSELAYLESINLLHLIRLETLYKGNFGPAGSCFASLRSVYVDNCSRMVTIFSSTPQSILLPQLKELVIRSCGKLIEVFGRGAVGSTVAPALRYLHLWDLPKLRNVCDGWLPSLRTLQLRGCVRLRTLPLPPVDSEGKPFKVEITAEHKWWENLNESNKKHIIFQAWSPWSTSRS